MNHALQPNQAVHEAALLPRLIGLVDHHRSACPAYARVLDAIGHGPARRYSQLEELPWLPVRLFKEHPLISTRSEPVAELTSSGTTGTGFSRIALDRDAADRQRLLLTATLEKLTGPRRLPLLIIDSPSAVREERSSIRGATVLGVMNVGREHISRSTANNASMRTQSSVSCNATVTRLSWCSVSRRWSGHSSSRWRRCAPST
jgi:hypothetical protein